LGVLAEVVGKNGDMARRPELLAFAERHRLVFITIAELVEYRRAVAAGSATTEQLLLTSKQPSLNKELNDARGRAAAFGMQSAS
jgi:hypothetical protein